MGSKIFLAEDNPDHALLISRGLAKSGFEVSHYTDGLALLDFFKRNPPAEELPAFLLLDLKLPGADGFEVLRQMRINPRYCMIPVIILTTSRYKQEINRAYEMGASGFVTKPDDFSELAAKLARVKDYWLRTVERPDFRG